MNYKDEKIIHDFGLEWEKFNQINADKKELFKIFVDYFSIFPLNNKTKNFKVLDVGCGTGRWAQFVAPNVHKLTLIDGSEKSINVAKKLLKKHKNIEFHVSNITKLPFKKNVFDFAYSLGVLHHVPEIENALLQIYKILKPNAPFLIYLYYSFENQPVWFRNVWRISNVFRKLISSSPYKTKLIICEVIAIFIYLPFAKFSKLLSVIGFDVEKIPLSYYKNKSLYTMRTDALDRFGTSYERRYSKKQITKLLQNAGFKNIQFSNEKPFWCALAYKG